MCAYMLLAAQAQTFFNTADVVSAVENFPDRRGTVIGIMKARHFLCFPSALLPQICNFVSVVYISLRFSYKPLN
jgi:hypothetical protein